MSRAFVKEQDNVPPDDPPEFEVSAGPNLVTRAGLDRINAKVAGIEAQLAANPDADGRVLLMRDLRYWVARKNSARIFVPSNPNEVEFGSQVTIERGGRHWPKRSLARAWATSHISATARRRTKSKFWRSSRNERSSA